MAEVAIGRQVTLEYRMLLEDGTLVDETSEGEPLVFSVGDGTLLAALESLLVGMRPGEQARFLLAPEDAFGFRDEENVHPMPRGEFPADMELAPGTVIAFAAPSGEEIPGMVLEADAETVKVDFNHPLAGRSLTFEVKILSVG